MTIRGLHQAIRAVADTGDFESVFDYFADDIEFTLSVDVRSPTSDRLRGRQCVIRLLQSLDGTESPRIEEPVDVFGGGERIVACRSASVAIGRGMTLGSECTLVFDVRNGKISRLAIRHELSTALTVGRPCCGGQASTRVQTEPSAIEAVDA